jgi:CheY-like chemotaxis protein
MDASDQKKILLVDNEVTYLMPYVGALRDHGYQVEIARNPQESMSALKNKQFHATIVDIMLPHADEFSHEETQGGHQTGLALARWIRKEFPSVLVVGISVRVDDEIVSWFDKHCSGFWPKMEVADVASFIRRVDALFQFKKRTPPTIFIVHGHDEKTKYELKNYIQNTLRLGEPIILHEQPSLGRTIIEKFEEETRNVDLVFVLMTPDDPIGGAESETIKWRARQNVVFELGFFFAKLQRKKGRVLVLHKGELDRPSDISGIIYIDITDGIATAGETIRQELRSFL